MAQPPFRPPATENQVTRPRRHRIVRACTGIVGGVLIVIGALSLIPPLTSHRLLLGVFGVDPPLSILRLVLGAALLLASFAPTFEAGRVLAIACGLIFGALGLAGGVSNGVAIGLFHVSAVDNTFNVLLCTVLVGVGALSLDRFREIAV